MGRIMSLFVWVSEIYSSCKYIIKLELVNYSKAESGFKTKPTGQKLENKAHLKEISIERIENILKIKMISAKNT
jgi:hypothetical protein